jgi:hypothetical protein
MLLSIDAITLGNDPKSDTQSSRLLQIGLVGELNTCYCHKTISMITACELVNLEFAIIVRICEVTNSDLMSSSVWCLLSNCCLPCCLIRICYGVWFVVTTLDLDCSWEGLLMSLAVDAITLSKDS